MTKADPRSRWWIGLPEPDDIAPLADPWPADDDDPGLSGEQVRFLESLADQPRVPRLTDGIPGFEHPGINPAGETGD